MNDEIFLSRVSKEFLLQEIKECIVSELDKRFAEPKKPIKEKEYLTRKEVSELLKVSLVTVHDWSKKGILKPQKVGSRVRYDKQEVLSALTSLER